MIAITRASVFLAAVVPLLLVVQDPQAGNRAVSNVGRPAFSNLSRPAISGAPVVGKRLVTSKGTWSGNPTRLTYRWLRCDKTGRSCRTIDGATARRYRLRSRDIGHRMRSRVRAWKASRSRSARSAPTGIVTRPTLPPLHVDGNRLRNSRGQIVRLRGVNRAGTEYACIQGWGIFDGPSDAASVRAIRSWGANVVRVPLNEDCWLGINGVKPELAGESYRQAIVDYVRLLQRHHMYAELSLMWAAPGTYPATYQSGGPDADHAPDLWASLASTFAKDRRVILAPWGETVVNADCFLDGGVCEATFGPDNTPYEIAGMQRAVDVMRQAGYDGVIAIPGIDYANDLSQWLSHKPDDPRNQLIAEAHVYGNNTCSTTDCFNEHYAPVADAVPLVFGETGETYDGSSCGSTNIQRLMKWADAHGVGYEAWVWDTWGNCSALIGSYDGSPYAAYGTWVRKHYRSLR